MERQDRTRINPGARKRCNRKHVFERPRQLCHKLFNSSFLLTLPIALRGRGASSSTHSRGTL